MTDAQPRDFSAPGGRLVWTVAVLTLLVAPALSAQTTQTTQPWRPTLFAHGAGDRYWIAQRDPYRDDSGKSGYKTPLRGRIVGRDWEELTTVYGAAEGLANVQGVAAVLLDDGAWKRVGSTFATGPNVPGIGPVLGWGASPTTLYAIRAVEGGASALPPPATQPTSQPTTQTTADVVPQATTAPVTTTRATTRPTVATLMVYDRGQWVGVADLPPSARGAAGSLAVVGAQPVFAYQDGNAVKTFAWGDSGWQDLGQVQAGTSIGHFGVLGLPDGAAVWVVDLDGAVRLFLRGEAGKWVQAQGFTLPADVPPDAQRTVAYAGDEIRLLLAKDGKFWEQDYDLTGNPKGAKTELPAPVKPAPPRGLWVFQLVVLGGMVLLLLVTYYRRKAAANSGNAEQE